MTVHIFLFLLMFVFLLFLPPLWRLDWPPLQPSQEPAIAVSTDGFACPNQQCPYFGITAARVHAPLWE